MMYQEYREPTDPNVRLRRSKMRGATPVVLKSTRFDPIAYAAALEVLG